ncbi:sensor histidine kinase [Anaerosacchariphilus sp. NSJ-68]|uniref:histidine kinase n=2 Tax=Lachnospiraceae TaxID=186803 RepID=A0A923LDR0_9FIRM|nr:MULTISPECIES: sensor histidine kinase [Lachnospiraceae]MBC5660708.1 sensor histidine kinase [Anaerosacchariphilus hominis]MBC5697930.1 sensor histidine kinase [Roseburia difficilis]
MRKSILTRFRSIRTSMIVSFATLIIFALLTFLVLSLRYTESTVLENSTEYTSQLIGQVNNDIDSYINYMENLSFIVANNTDVRDYLFAENLTEQRKNQLQERITALFENVKDTRGDITNIAVIPQTREPLINNGVERLNPYVDVKELSWYQEALKARGEAAISSSHVQNAVQEHYDWVVTLSRYISNRVTPEIGGVFFVDLNYNAIQDLCERISLGNKGYIYILDQSGAIVYHPQQQLIYSGMKQELLSEVMETEESSFLTEDGKLYTISRSEATGWTVVGVSYVSELMAGADSARLVYALTALVLFAAALALAYLLSREITKPIQRLQGSMKEVERGNFDNAAIQVWDDNEIGSLSRSFNIMTEEIQKLMKQSEREQRAKRKYELRVLQSQISPHFLYNTLDSIIWMAEWGKNQEVVTMTSSLARLLRRTISNEQELVTIAEEIDCTEAYLTIQKMRYKDKLEYEIELEDGIGREKIVKLVLQPLVENAIYHGIKYKEGRGLIQIRVFCQDDCIVLQVEDDGKGMDEETLAHIFEQHIRDTRSNGVGVNNVNERIRLFYGAEYGLSFKSEPEKGTTATIWIPLGKDGENHDNE